MSRSVTSVKSVRGIGLFSIIAGAILFFSGAGTWVLVSSQLSAEGITVSEDASFMAGQRVRGPLTAYAQAEVINTHALKISGGKTYAELPQDDERRATVQSASFLRASLFTSVVSFGTAALVLGLGVLFALLGFALRRIASGFSGEYGHRSPAHAVVTSTEPTDPPPSP